MRVSTFTGGAKRMGRAVLELPATWRGSLQLRVVSLTLLMSIVIAFLLGWVLNTKIRDGLVQAKESSSAAMVSSGFSEASNLIAASAEKLQSQSGAAGGAARQPNLADWVGELNTMVNNLCSGSSSDTYQVLLIPAHYDLPVGGLVCGG